MRRGNTKDTTEDIVDEAIDAVTASQDVEWDRCTRIATPDQRRMLHHLRALARLFGGREASRSLAAEEEAPLAGLFARRAAYTLIGIAAIEATATLALLPWEWRDYYRDHGDVAVYLTTWFLGHVASACLLLLAGRHDRRAWLLGVFFLFKATAAPLHMLPAFWGEMPPSDQMNEGQLFELPAPVQAFLYLYVGPFLYAPACLWVFARVCPRIRRRTRLDDVARRMVPFSVGVAVTLTLAAAVLYATRAMSAAAFSNFIDACVAIPNILSLGAVVVIVLRAHTAPPDEARRVTLFSVGLALWMGFMTVVDVAEVFVAGQWLSNYERTPLFTLMHVGSFPGLALLWYSVLAARVPHTREVVRTSGRWLLMRPGLLGIAVAAPAVVLAGVLARGPERPVGAVSADPAAQALLTATVVFLLLAMARRRLLRGLDAWVYPETTDQRQVLAEAAVALAKVESEATLRRTVTRTVKRGIGSPAALLMAASHEPDAHNFRARDSHAAIGPLPRSSAIVHVLETAGGALRVHPGDAKSVFELLPDSDAAWAADAAADVVVPIPGPGTEVVGMLVVGRRFDDRIVRAADVPFLEVLAAAAGQPLTRLRSLAAPGKQRSDAPPAVECPVCRCVTGTDEAPGCDCGQAYVETGVPRTLANKYRLTRRLGAGGMGSVYLAHDVTLHRDVAVKTLHRMSARRLLAAKPEAWAMARVAHPAVAQIHGVESWRGRPFLVVEFLADGTLADRLRDGPLPATRAVAVAALLADALDALHRAGYLHGDVKPSNVGFTADGSPKLLDFGLARPAHDGTVGGGTLRYLSPEILDGCPAAEADDVWSLCVLLYEMTSGAHPFAGDGQTEAALRIRRQIVGHGAPLSAGTDPRSMIVIRFAESILTAPRLERPPSARTFADALRAMLRGS